eukprot:TRINITY_DN61973_c0_g1_i1.p1 TRINITY_DN61973_c0_g1~~TRINITY_DN61973_c0_g1_i1.p1  ORF type:complete len:252 (-),score=53.06 TRINITY_DN61973_c0_g1_i1:318-1073(-)
MASTAPKMSRRPQMNTSDLTELMPGAQPSANPAQREHFEATCRKLYQQELEDEITFRPRLKVAATDLTFDLAQLEAMFPTLEPALIHTMVADSRSLNHAVELLLTLAASISEPADCHAVAVPERDLKLKDGVQFPSLVDSGGCEVVGNKHLEQDSKDLGSAWRDCAKNAVSIPAQTPKSRVVWAPAVRQQRQEKHNEVYTEDDLTEYEARQLAGRRHAEQRAQRQRRRAPAILQGQDQRVQEGVVDADQEA